MRDTMYRAPTRIEVLRTRGVAEGCGDKDFDAAGREL